MMHLKKKFEKTNQIDSLKITSDRNKNSRQRSLELSIANYIACLFQPSQRIATLSRQNTLNRRIQRFVLRLQHIFDMESLRLFFFLSLAFPQVMHSLQVVLIKIRTALLTCKFFSFH